MSTWSFMNTKGQGHWLTLVQIFQIFQKPNFMWSLLGIGERKLIQMVQVTWQRPYMVKTIEDIFLWNRKADDLESWNLVYSIEYYSTTKFFSNDAPGLTLTYFMTRWAPMLLYWKKVKTMAFSETIVVYDIKVVRCSHQNERFMSTKGQGHSLTLV